MIKERVIAWYEHSKRVPTLPFPTAIYLYRDGVSDSQYGMVLNEERPQIRQGFNDAVQELKAKNILPRTSTIKEPKEVIIVVTKRHHTRFYPTANSTQPGLKTKDPNLSPGTVVSSPVVSPTTFAFHLQSHESGLGTARSALYTLIYSDLDPSHINKPIPAQFMSQLQSIVSSNF